ncbi:MAG: hypothetical protein IT436_08975 [Phycisphaerales bacterium]|nr:hypothetical protein [Phycisphaerales bacterium]
MIRNSLVLAILPALVSAAPARPGPDPSAEFQRQYHALALEGQPAAGPNALDLVGPVAERIKAVTAEVMAKQFPGEKPEMVDLQALTREAATPREKEIARAVLAALIKSDVPRLAAELAAAPRSVKPEGTGLLFNQMLPQLGRFRQIARFEAGRMALAQEAGDTSAWLTAFAETMRLGRQASQEPVLISALVGIAVQSLAFDSAHRLIASGVDDTTLVKVAGIVRASPQPGLDRQFRGEQLMAEDALDYIYDTGPEAIKVLRQPTNNPPARPAEPVVAEGDAMGPGMPPRAEHRRLITDYYTKLRAWARLPAVQRKAIGASQTLGRAREESLLLQTLSPAFEKAVAALDQSRAERAGLLTVIAIERFKLAKGTYPANLGALSGDLLTEPAVDPYTGGPLGYLPPSKGPYEGGRAYVLYAAGIDASDDGGKVDFGNPTSVNKEGATGDLLLNRYAPSKK